MHPILRAFVRQYVAVVFAAFAPVVLTTFVSIPMSLGAYPGDSQNASISAERHLT